MHATATEARGLSDLQIAILARAIGNVWRRGDDEAYFEGGVHVYGCEVAADYFGWPSPYVEFRDRRGRSEWSVYLYCRRPEGATAGDANRVHAAICRAFRRLEDRGLGERVSGAPARWSGFRLNAEGARVAERVSRDAAVGLQNARPDRGGDVGKAGGRAASRESFWLDMPGAAKRLGIPIGKVEALDRQGSRRAHGRAAPRVGSAGARPRRRRRMAPRSHRDRHGRLTVGHRLTVEPDAPRRPHSAQPEEMHESSEIAVDDESRGAYDSGWSGAPSAAHGVLMPAR